MVREGTKSDLIPKEPLHYEEVSSLLWTYPTVQASVTLQWGLEASCLDADHQVLCGHAPGVTKASGSPRTGWEGGSSRMYVAEIGTVSNWDGWFYTPFSRSLKSAKKNTYIQVA